VGSIIDHNGYHTHGAGSAPAPLESAVSKENIAQDEHEQEMDEAELQKAFENGYMKGEVFQGKPDTADASTEKKVNARDNGCNPVTGDGYTQETVLAKSQKRQYPQARSASLW